jgi:probable F420-dependent oxidoreductase
VPVDLGPLGLWTSVLDQQPAVRARELAAELEEQGWGTVWIPEAVLRDPLVHAALLLDSTDRLVVATGIANIYARTPMAMNNGWQSLSEAFPDRFLLGLGVSHQPLVEGLFRETYGPPLTAMREYLDAIDASYYAAPPPPTPPQRVLAALGPKMLELARDKADGAHPYLVTPEHTALAREILGPERVLAPEQKVVLETDPEQARAIARRALAVYVPGLPNYVNNLRRLGFTDDVLQDPPSERLVVGIVAWGDVDVSAARLQAHRDGGADHVAVQVLGDDTARVLRDTRTLGESLH